MSMNKSAANSGRHWPLSIVGFFIVLALVNALVVYLALQSKSEYLESSPYEKGLAFDRVIEERLAANNSGLKLRYEFGDVEQDGTREIRLLIDGDTSISEDTPVHLEALRLSDSALDQSVDFERRGVIYLARAKIAAQGLWLFRLSIGAGDKKLLFESRETLPRPSQPSF